jgi:hypothetical protein
MEEKPYERKKLLAVGVVAAVVAALIIVVVVVLAVMSGGGTKPTGTTTDDDVTKTLFYDALGSAAGQPQIRVAMYRATYASKKDADVQSNIGTQASSVAELDLGTAKSRSVYATNVTKPSEFTVGRCMDGATYDFNSTATPRPASLAAAAEELKTNQHLYRSSVPIFNPCPQIGIMAEASVDLASFRLSDGVMPVTLTKERADNWKKQIKEADLFTLKDEGMVERDGHKLKKISFTPKNPDETNGKLYNVYRSAAEVDKIIADQPKAIYQYEFLSINPGNTGGIGGYYLIDDAAKLPVYSELYGTNKDRDSGQSSSRFNLARTKQAYTFEKPLSLTMESPLEILE